MKVILKLALLTLGAPTAACSAQSACVQSMLSAPRHAIAFHTVWPYQEETNLLGTILRVSPGKDIEAQFGMIDAPDYRPVGAAPLSVSTIVLSSSRSCVTPEIVPVDLAFETLAILSAALTKGPKPGSLKSNVYDVSQVSKPASFEHFTGSSVQFGPFTETYYGPSVLARLNAGTLLNPAGASLLTGDRSGWMISRVIVTASIRFDFIADRDIPAAFAAQLATAFPGFRTQYKSARRLRIASTQPWNVGFVLWQRNTGGDTISKGCSQTLGCELDESMIDQVLSDPLGQP